MYPFLLHGLVLYVPVNFSMYLSMLICGSGLTIKFQFLLYLLVTYLGHYLSCSSKVSLMLSVCIKSSRNLIIN